MKTIVTWVIGIHQIDYLWGKLQANVYEVYENWVHLIFLTFYSTVTLLLEKVWENVIEGSWKSHWISFLDFCMNHVFITCVACVSYRLFCVIKFSYKYVLRTCANGLLSVCENQPRFALWTTCWAKSIWRWCLTNVGIPIIKMMRWDSHLYDGNSYIVKATCLCWINPWILNQVFKHQHVKNEMQTGENTP